MAGVVLAGEVRRGAQVLRAVTSAWQLREATSVPGRSESRAGGHEGWRGRADARGGVGARQSPRGAAAETRGGSTVRGECAGGARAGSTHTTGPATISGVDAAAAGALAGLARSTPQRSPEGRGPGSRDRPRSDLPQQPPQ